MSQLPFEVGRLSTMSENEMYDLSQELDRMDFWHQEREIHSIVTRYITTYWSNPSPSATYYGPVYRASVYAEKPTIDTTGRVREIVLRVPHGIDEGAARLFAEIQVREQMDPSFDPTEDET
jgi:hypothetical protein